MTQQHGPIETWTDQELIAAANRGDRRAMEALYFRYRDWAVSLAMHFCRIREDAYDVAQEVFIYLFGKFPGFELTCRMKTFLYPVIKNVSLNITRRQSRMVQMNEFQRDQLVARRRDYEAEQRELAEIVAGLPDGQREVILLRFADGLSMAEIAEALGIPIGTVKSRLHNALQQLKKMKKNF